MALHHRRWPDVNYTLRRFVQFPWPGLFELPWPGPQSDAIHPVKVTAQAPRVKTRLRLLVLQYTVLRSKILPVRHMYHLLVPGTL